MFSYELPKSIKVMLVIMLFAEIMIQLFTIASFWQIIVFNYTLRMGLLAFISVYVGGVLCALYIAIGLLLIPITSIYGIKKKHYKIIFFGIYYAIKIPIAYTYMLGVIAFTPPV